MCEPTHNSRHCSVDTAQEASIVISCHCTHEIVSRNLMKVFKDFFFFFLKLSLLGGVRWAVCVCGGLRY